MAAAATPDLASSASTAAPLSFDEGAFVMLDSTGVIVGVDDTVSGWIDPDAMTFGVASTSPFFGFNWIAPGGTLLGPGTCTISTADPAPGASGGFYTVTVGVNQIGGQIDFAWGGTTGIDVVMVWDVAYAGCFHCLTLTSVDTDADLETFVGTSMIDGPFQGLSANFNLALVPEASTYAMMLAGLGLIGAAAAWRQRLAAQARGRGSSDFQKA